MRTRRLILIPAMAVMAVILSACGHLGSPEPLALPKDECPSAATAALETTPTDPITTDAQREAKYGGIIGALGETVGVAVIEHDDVTLPAHAERGWQRVGEMQRWCATRR